MNDYQKVGTAQRAKFHDARRHFESGGEVLVSEYGHEADLPVTRLSVTHTAERITWESLAETVRDWRGRYPNQRFYIVTRDAA